MFYLKKNYRQGSAEGKALATFLANCREAALTEDDFAWFESRSAEVLSKDGFAKAYDEGCAGVVHARVYVKFTLFSGVHLFPSNDQVNDHNLSTLQSKGEPVCVCVAVNSDKKSWQSIQKIGRWPRQCHLLVHWSQRHVNKKYLD